MTPTTSQAVRDAQMELADAWFLGPREATRALANFESAVRADEAASWQLATAMCEEHRPSGGARSRCVICSGLVLSRALARIDYSLGTPNEMELADYEIDYDEERVITRVQKARDEAAGLVDILARLLKVVEQEDACCVGFLKLRRPHEDHEPDCPWVEGMNAVAEARTR